LRETSGLRDCLFLLLSLTETGLEYAEGESFMSAILENEESVATTQQPIINVADTNGVKQRLITVAEYDKMIEHGILNEDSNVELLNGVIIEIMSKGPKHASALSRINRFFFKLFGDDVIIRLQDPIVLDDLSEPEPDLVLARLDDKEYSEGHPKPEDIFLILEISDTTVSYDRNAKATAYARGGIIQYLLLNLQNQTIEDYRDPAEDGYQSKQTYHTGQSFKLVVFPDVEIDVASILI
jgi:Uma2 family endonuclease